RPLICMFGRGRARPAGAACWLVLDTAVARCVPATIGSGRVGLEPTSGIGTVRAGYTLAEAGRGKPLASGTRSVQAPYDIPVQDFAAERAARDAENRAARELAELLRLVVGQELARR